MSIELQTPDRPFRFWCQKVLPLVYDDSLSYYELLCKVVEYLNNTMSDVRALGAAFLELESFVDNYFDNLDVSEEIDNKLDQMAVDGTLTAVIASYVQPVLDTFQDNVTARLYAQDAEIARLQHLVGSPLMASTASQMTDTDKVYVYTGSEVGYTAGNWYYWNGTAWTSGGVYNSAAVETDRTLTIHGAAADAAACGDLKRELLELSDSYIAYNVPNNLSIATSNNNGITDNHDGTFTLSTSDYGATVFNSAITFSPGLYYLYGVPTGVSFLTPTTDLTSAYTSRVVSNETNTLFEFLITEEQTLYLGYRVGSNPDAEFTIAPMCYTKQTFEYITEKKHLNFSLIKNVGAANFGWINAAGDIRADTDEVLAYTPMFKVNPGDVITSNGVGHISIRFVCAYNHNKQPVYALGTNNPVLSYTVPDGAEYLVVTLWTEVPHDLSTMPTITIAKRTDDYILPALDDTLTSKLLPPPAEPVGIVYGDYEKQKSLLKRGDMASGDKWELEENNVAVGQVLAFSGEITSFTGLRIGHGYAESEGNYIQIDATNVYEYGNANTLLNTYPHGLTIENNIQVKIESKNENAYNAYLTLASSGSVFTQTLPNWYGDSGSVFAESVGSALTYCSFGWTSKLFDAPVFVCGDSYLGFATTNRWPYYLIRDGYYQLLDGYGGRTSLWAMKSLKKALEHGTPRYIFWCMGMNDPDTGEVNENWLNAVNELINICEKQGIVPILSTIPNVTNVAKNNTYKNAWVRNSGYRYVDFASAVGGNSNNASWYDGMLNEDGTHPNTKGAVALYYQVLADFPEITIVNK